MSSSGVFRLGGPGTSPYELRGAGSPVGVVTPPAAGAYYTDTAGTLGAWRWVATGTTNTSWLVVSGNTGPHNVTPTPGLITSGTITAQRINATVYLSLIDLQIAALDSGGGKVTPLTGTALPLGMWAAQYVSISTATTVRRALLGIVSDRRMVIYSAVVGDVVNGTIVAPADATPWPTAFPS